MSSTESISKEDDIKIKGMIDRHWFKDILERYESTSEAGKLNLVLIMKSKSDDQIWREVTKVFETPKKASEPIIESKGVIHWIFPVNAEGKKVE